MFRSKKFLVCLLVFSLAFSSIFSGCRSKTPPSTLTHYDGVELTYYKVFDDSDIIEPMINEYLGTHPGLKIKYRKFSDLNEYQTAILNEMAEGKGPDIFSMPNTWFASNYHKLTPVPTTLGTISDFEKTFVDVARNDLVRTDDNGDDQIFALPMTVDTLGLYYNKAQFEDRIPERGRPSETWEGIKADAITLTKASNTFSRFDVSGIALGRADNITRAVDILYLLFLQYGVNFYNENISKATFGDGTIAGAVSNPAMEALNFYVGFANENNKQYTWNAFTADSLNPSPEIEAFATGKVSMIVGYSYTYDDIVKQIDQNTQLGIKTISKSDIRVSEIPQLYDPKIASDKRVTYASYFAETVSRNTKNADLAWDFLIFMTNKKNQQYYFDKLHKPTSRRDLIDTESKDPIFGPFALQIGYAESFPILDYYRYKEIFIDVINQANKGSVVASNLIHAQDLINEMLPEKGLIPPKKPASASRTDKQTVNEN